MLNYIKSEWYKTVHSKGVYLAGGVMCGLVLLMNLILWGSNHFISNFPYGTFRFSLNTLTAQPYLDSCPWKRGRRYDFC